MNRFRDLSKVVLIGRWTIYRGSDEFREISTIKIMTIILIKRPTQFLGTGTITSPYISKIIVYCSSFGKLIPSINYVSSELESELIVLKQKPEI